MFLPTNGIGIGQEEVLLRNAQKKRMRDWTMAYRQTSISNASYDWYLVRTKYGYTTVRIDSIAPKRGNGTAEPNLAVAIATNYIRIIKHKQRTGYYSWKMQYRLLIKQ